jgi:hypothetical protein
MSHISAAPMPAFNQTYRQQFEFAVPLTTQQRSVTGVSFTLLGQYEGHWADVRAASGMLSQSGDLVVLNPDKHAGILCLEVLHDTYAYYNAGTGTYRDGGVQGDQSGLQLIAYLRPTAESDQALALRLLAEVPAAKFACDLTEDFVPLRGMGGERSERVLKEMGENEPLILRKAFTVISLRASQPDTTAFTQLMASPLLSTDPAIRQGFTALLGPMFTAVPKRLEPLRREQLWLR